MKLKQSRRQIVRKRVRELSQMKTLAPFEQRHLKALQEELTVREDMAALGFGTHHGGNNSIKPAPTNVFTLSTVETPTRKNYEV